MALEASSERDAETIRTMCMNELPAAGGGATENP
jgi:hypothetical protein